MARAGIAALVLGALLLASCASNPEWRDYRFGRDLKPIAQPGEVVATELAFARMAREEGQWSAFAEYAADDAVMFVPEPVNAKEWLKGRANPAKSVEWEPYQVWSSCDGSLAVTKGAWQRPDGSVGYFTTVWERQEKGDYKWVLDMGDTLELPLKEPDMIGAEVADCGDAEVAEGVGFREQPLVSRGDGASRDNTLSFDWAAYEDASVDLSVSMMKSHMMVEVSRASVAGKSE